MVRLTGTGSQALDDYVATSYGDWEGALAASGSGVSGGGGGLPSNDYGDWQGAVSVSGLGIDSGAYSGPQWSDNGTPGGMYTDQHGNVSYDGGVTWSNGYSNAPATNAWGDVGGAVAVTPDSGFNNGAWNVPQDPWMQNAATGEEPWRKYDLGFGGSPLTEEPIDWRQPTYAEEYAGEYDPKTFISEDTLSTLTPEQRANALGRANRFATEWNANSTQTPGEFFGETLGVAGSARRAADVLLPGNPGTAAYNAISDIPYVGRPIAGGLDVALAPATLATLGTGGAASAGGNVGRGLAGAFLGGAAQEGTKQYGETELPGANIAANPWVQAGVGLGAGVAGFYGPEIGAGLARGGKAAARGLDNVLTGEGRLAGEVGGVTLPSAEQFWAGARALTPYATRSAIGAGAGAAIAAETGNDPWKGAAIGAAAGLGTAAIGQAAKGIVERRLPATAAASRPGAADKVIDLVKQAKPIEAEQRALRSAELSKRVGKAAGMLSSGKGETAFARSTGPLSGQLPKEAFTAIRPSLTVDDVFDLFEYVRTGQGQYFEKLNTAGALTKLLSGELPTRSEISLLGKAFGEDFAAAVLAKRSLGVKAWETFVDSVNIPRTLITAFDASAPLRQGAILFAGHPIEGTKALGTMVKAMASPKYTELVDDAIRNSPNAPIYEKMGIYFAPLGKSAQLYQREEAIMSRLAGQLPGVGGSQRGYVAFLNKIRQGVADNWIAGHPNVTDKEMAGFGHWVNIASGRGDLPGILKNNTAAMNALFAPRYAMSRLQLGPEVIKQMASGGAVRGEVARDVMAFIGTGVGVLALGKASGLWTVELNPLSTDFGKGKMGNTRFDFWAGEQQVARYGAQLLTAKRKTSTGEIVGANRGDVVRRWLQSKQAPYIGVASDLLTGKTFTGEKPTLGGELYQHLVPLFVQDMTDAANEGVSPFRAIPAAFGAGVQTYQDSDYKKRNDFSIEKFGFPYEKLDLPQREEVDREHGKYLSTFPASVQRREESAAIADTTLDKQHQIDAAYGKPVALPPGESPSLTNAVQPAEPKSMKDAEAWRDNYHVIQDQAQGGREVRDILDPFTGKPYGGEMDKARSAYFDQIDASKLGGKVDWDAVDAWRATNPEIDKLLIQYENDHQMGTTPMVQTYKADVKQIADSLYWDISDRVLDKWATAKGLTVPEGQTVHQFLTDTEVEIRKRLKAKGLTDQSADLLASQLMGDLTKDYATTVTAVRKAFREANPEVTDLLIKWGYYDPGKEDTAKIVARDLAGAVP